MTDEPIRVTHVSIDNFRCFEHLEGDMSKITSVVGENGSGKTALIEALNYCLAPYTNSGRFCEQDFNNEDAGDITIEVAFSKTFVAEVPDGYTAQKIECDRVRLRVARRKAAGAGRALNDPFTLEHVALPIEGKYGAEPNWALKRGTGTIFKFGLRSLSLSSVDLSDYPTVHYFGKTREKQSTGGYNTTFQRVLEELNWRYRKGLDGKEGEVEVAWDTYYELVIGCVDNAKRKALVDDFIKNAEDLLGDDCSDVELSLVRLEEPFGKGFMTRRSGLNQIDLGGLGSGVAMLMTLVLLETVSGLEKEAIIFLIDEPEMHLHPQLQARVQKHLAASVNQVIYTTHSPLMVDLGEWRSIRRMDGGDSLFPTDETRALPIKNENGDAFPLEAWLDDIIGKQKHITMLLRENNEMLFARCVALVEGAADKYAITLLAEPLGYDLQNITVIPAHGKSKIPEYQMLCKVFGLPFFTVYDADTGKDDDANLSERIAALATDGCVYEFDPNLEDCLGIGANAKHKGQKTVDAIEACAEKPADTPAKLTDLINTLAAFQTECREAVVVEDVEEVVEVVAEAAFSDVVPQPTEEPDEDFRF